MRKERYWKNPTYKPGEALGMDLRTRFLIVGGGISGLSLAHFLLQRKVDPAEIIIVETDIVGNGSTGHSAGMLVPESETEHDISWQGFIKRYGIPLTKKYRQAHFDALKTIETILKDGSIECEAEWEDLLLLAGKDSEGLVKNSIEARKKLGEFPGTLRGICLSRELASPRFTIAGKTERGLSVNPLKLVQGFADYLREQGIQIYEHSPVLKLGRNKALFKRHTVRFEHAILARGMGETKKTLNRYVTTIAVTNRISKKNLKVLRLNDRDMFVDEHEVGSYHYGKVTKEGRLLLGYGDVQTTKLRSQHPLHLPHVRNIKRFLKRAFPQVPLSVDYAWSAAYAITKNDLPLVTSTRDTTYLNGAGIQLGQIVAADYVSAKLLNKKHPLKKLFS